MKPIQATPITAHQRPVNLIEIAERGQGSAGLDKLGETSFKDVLSQELQDTVGLTFSKHAQQRLYSRGIELDQATLQRVSEAVDRAGAKGSRETLILTDDAALVVSVNNRTVITAFDRNHLQEGVVTSIDSAVIV